MKLMTEEIRDALPTLYATQEQKDPVAYAKFFTPWSDWTWYATEYDGVDTCFGLVCGLEEELGYFSLSDLEGVRGPGGISIERDPHFDPTPLSQLGRRSRAVQIEIEQTAKRLRDRETLACQTSLVNHLIDSLAGFKIDDMINYIDTDDAQLFLVRCEWLLVTETLANLLISHGEVVLRNQFGSWWGRIIPADIWEGDGIFLTLARKLVLRP